MRRALALGILAAVAFSSPARAGEGPIVGRIDESLARAARFLVDAQSPDGGWRSTTYGMYRDGPVLTPYVMSALFFLPQGGPAARESFRRGVQALLEMSGREDLPYPVLTATMASRVVVLETKDERYLRAQAAFLALARSRQLTEDLGWSPDDPEYGGWGFSIEPPRKPEPGRLRERFFESNLLATIFGLAALRSARVPPSDPAWAKALAFVQRCQNWEDDPAKRDERFDDGGFFFIPSDEAQNKAGNAGTDRLGRKRFRSYGTMTADGLRALLQCGLPKDHPRVAAALGWLERHFSASRNPGDFEEGREVLRDGMYYYWAWSAAHAFARAGVRSTRWAELLAEELLRRQARDGAWRNPYTAGTEDDPLIATPWAASALAVARQALTGEGPGR
jgi:squalene-hopene/tetraprenyl-beta-curcumene cyclase